MDNLKFAVSSQDFPLVGETSKKRSSWVSNSYLKSVIVSSRSSRPLEKPRLQVGTSKQNPALALPTQSAEPNVIGRFQFLELAVGLTFPPLMAPVQYDPMIGILANFQAIPDEYRNDMFTDFRTVAEAEDLRGLLDTISDWAATAELHANPSLATDVQEAIGGRQEVGDWLSG